MAIDQLLINQLKNKDEKALSMLYDKYSSAIYGVIIRILKNEEQAQDVLQDTFLTVWNKGYLYDSEKGRFYTWIYRIARNKSLNSLRKNKKLIQTEDLSVYTNISSVEDSLPESFTELKGAMSKLDSHHRKAIELVYFNGFTHNDAHKEMDIPLGTFKSYVRQALKKLQASYAKTVPFLYMLIDIMR